MEVSLVSPQSLKIKSKKASIVVDPQTKMPKTPADAVVAMDPNSDLTRVEEYRLVISDDGEYEVGGIKVSVESDNSHRFYNLRVDEARVILGKVSDLEKNAESRTEADVAILKVDSDLDESIVASLESKYILLYGEKSAEGLKALGKNSLSGVKKFSPSKDKQSDSAETQIIWLA